MRLCVACLAVLLCASSVFAQDRIVILANQPYTVQADTDNHATHWYYLELDGQRFGEPRGDESFREGVISFTGQVFPEGQRTLVMCAANDSGGTACSVPLYLDVRREVAPPPIPLAPSRPGLPRLIPERP